MLNRPHLLTSVVGAGLMLTGGCRTSERAETLPEQGPDPAFAVPGTASGTLVVFTAPSTRADPLATLQRLTYSDYRLETATGSDLGTIKNHSDSVWEGPVAVRLPAGRYRINAHATGRGGVVVPVRVVEGLTTTVHLDVAPPAEP